MEVIMGFLETTPQRLLWSSCMICGSQRLKIKSCLLRLSWISLHTIQNNNIGTHKVHRWSFGAAAHSIFDPGHNKQSNTWPTSSSWEHKTKTKPFLTIMKIGWESKRILLFKKVFLLFQRCCSVQSASLRHEIEHDPMMFKARAKKWVQ